MMITVILEITSNPRAGLTWEFIKGYDLKLLYGRAFRSPSFFELYDPGFGNPDLDPEEVDTYQVSLGAQFTPSLNSRITWFRNRIKNAIVLDFETGRFGFWDWNYVNRDTIRSEGLEIELKYDLGRGSYLGCNYRYMIFQKRFMEWEIPRHIGNIMPPISVYPGISIFTLHVILKTGLEGKGEMIATMCRGMAS